MLTSGEWLIFATTILIYLIFLLFDLFKRDEPYGNIVYIAAVIPVNYFWFLITSTPENIDEYQIGVTGAWSLLFVFWLFALIRDLIYVEKKKKDFDDVIGYLLVGLLIQLILSSVLPYSVSSMREGTFRLFNIAYLPDLVTAIPLALNLFRILLSILVIGLVIPMIFLELRGESVNMWALLIIDLIFALPFSLIAFIWVPDAWIPLLLLVEVVFFIILLLITRGGPQK